MDLIIALSIIQNPASEQCYRVDQAEDWHSEDRRRTFQIQERKFYFWTDWMHCYGNRWMEWEQLILVNQEKEVVGRFTTLLASSWKGLSTFVLQAADTSKKSSPSFLAQPSPSSVVISLAVLCSLLVPTSTPLRLLLLLSFLTLSSHLRLLLRLSWLVQSQTTITRSGFLLMPRAMDSQNSWPLRSKRKSSTLRFLSARGTILEQISPPWVCDRRGGTMLQSLVNWQFFLAQDCTRVDLPEAASPEQVLAYRSREPLPSFYSFNIQNLYSNYPDALKPCLFRSIYPLIGPPLFLISVIMNKKFNLKYFILAQQALTLYRQFFKLTSKIPEQQTKEELRRQVRQEFERYRGVEDTNKMEYLIVTGRKQLAMLSSYTANAQ